VSELLDESREIVVALRDLRRVADAFAGAGKLAVAAWLRDQETRLVAAGHGSEDLIEIGLRPDAEMSN
jgi:hypothetical protein